MVFFLNWRNGIITGTTKTKLDRKKLKVNTECTEEAANIILKDINSILNIDEIEIASKWAANRGLIIEDLKTKKMAKTHVIEHDQSTGLVSIMGGKWTTFRKMGQEGLDRTIIEMSKHRQISIQERDLLLTLKTDNLRSIGDYRDKLYDLNEKQEELNKNEFNKVGINKLEELYPEIPFKMISTLYGSYGMRSSLILTDLVNNPDKQVILDQETLLTKAEIEHLYNFEFCTNSIDLLARRTRTALLDNESTKR